MPRDKYTKNRFWLFPQATNVIDGTTDVDGIPFRGNYSIKKTSLLNPQSNTYKSVETAVIKTTSQLEFKEFQKIAKTSNPSQDDFSIIDNVDRIPYLENGNKHRSKEYWEYTITLQ